MSQPPDEDDDQIFSGKALSEDGALKPAPGNPRPNVVPPRPTRPPATRPPPPAPPMPGASMLDDPAWEPAFSTISPRNPNELSSGLELAERAPPPASSDFVIPRPEKPIRFSTLDVPWGKWILRVVILGALAGGIWVVMTGKLSLGKFSMDLLKSVKSSPTSKPGAADQEEGAKSRPAQAPSLLVLSEPSGATVFVGGTEVGVTPWAGDNVWPAEPLKIEVRKAGYRPWVGMTVGGKQATLEASLKQR